MVVEWKKETNLEFWEKTTSMERLKVTKSKYEPMRLNFWISNLFQVFDSWLYIN